MRKSIALAAAVVGVGAVSVLAADLTSESGPSFWMKKKLEYSERLLAGLASGDFDEIGQSARSMGVLTYLERWVHAGQHPGYREQLKAFQTANERIIRAADKEDLDSAAQGFTQLTTSCVNCHKVVRDVQKK